MQNRENPIYRNIGYDPKIWGLSYKSLFGGLGLLLVGIMLFRGVLGLVGGFSAGLTLAGLFYAFSFWNESRDKVEAAGRKTPIRRIVAAHTTGTQRVKIK